MIFFTITCPGREQARKAARKLWKSMTGETYIAPVDDGKWVVRASSEKHFRPATLEKLGEVKFEGGQPEKEEEENGEPG